MIIFTLPSILHFLLKLLFKSNLKQKNEKISKKTKKHHISKLYHKFAGDFVFAGVGACAGHYFGVIFGRWAF